LVPVTGAAVPVEVEGAVWAWLSVATPRRAESKSVVFIGNREKIVCGTLRRNPGRVLAKCLLIPCIILISAAVPPGFQRLLYPTC
jgi:hypothetical protein